jgi:hypothetical protein
MPPPVNPAKTCKSQQDTTAAPRNACTSAISRRCSAIAAVPALAERACSRRHRAQSGCRSRCQCRLRSRRGREIFWRESHHPNWRSGTPSQQRHGARPCSNPPPVPAKRLASLRRHVHVLLRSICPFRPHARRGNIPHSRCHPPSAHWHTGTLAHTRHTHTRIPGNATFDKRVEFAAITRFHLPPSPPHAPAAHALRPRPGTTARAGCTASS